jgi:hypothetical protein
VALVIATQETVTVQMVASVSTVNVDPLFWAIRLVLVLSLETAVQLRGTVEVLPITVVPVSAIPEHAFRCLGETQFPDQCAIFFV